MCTTTKLRSSSMRVMSSTSDSSTRPLILTGYPTSWMPLPGPCHSSVKRVSNRALFPKINNTSVLFPVTDMLLALLNCCTKEELEESSSDEETLISPTTPSEESQERRKVIKNKILAVGRMSRVFALLRYATSNTHHTLIF